MGLIYPPFPGMRRSVGLLLIRGVTGAAFLFHGWPKIQNATTWMSQMSPQTPAALQAAAAVAEFGGGIALILGLLTPLACLGIAGVMLTALTTVHWPHGDPFVGHGGPSWELAAVYLCVVLGVLLLGPGRLSVDGLIFGRFQSAESEPPL